MGLIRFFFLNLRVVSLFMAKHATFLDFKSEFICKMLKNL